MNRLCAHTCDVVNNEGREVSGHTAPAPGELRLSVHQSVPREGSRPQPPADETGVAPGAAESATMRRLRVQLGPTTSPPLFSQTTTTLSPLRGCPLVALLHWDPDVMGGGGNHLGELTVQPPAVAVAWRGRPPAHPRLVNPPLSAAVTRGAGGASDAPPAQMPLGSWPCRHMLHPRGGGAEGWCSTLSLAALAAIAAPPVVAYAAPISSPGAGRPVPARRRGLLTPPPIRTSRLVRNRGQRDCAYRIGARLGGAAVGPVGEDAAAVFVLFMVVGSVLEAPYSALAVALAWKHSPCVSSRRLRPD